jgi:hypothetical protein
VTEGADWKERIVMLIAICSLLLLVLLGITVALGRGASALSQSDREPARMAR